MTTFVSYFSGFGGSDLGAIAAGWNPVGAVEMVPAISAVYRDNIGDHIQVADICDIDPAQWKGVDGFLASPVCKNFSVAKADGKESDVDRLTALACVRFIVTVKPRYVVIENVQQYIGSDAFNSIVAALVGESYNVKYSVLCAADYGIPQSRRRLILRAVRGASVREIMPTHYNPREQASLFLEPWNGWYAAIEDLLPTCPESSFAPWQLARLPEWFGRDNRVLAQGCYDKLVSRGPDEPMNTITSNSNQNQIKAYIVDGQTNDNGTDVTVRESDAPMFTIGASVGKRPPRAYLAGTNGEHGDMLRQHIAPAPTIVGGHNAAKYRVMLVEGDAAGGRPPTTLETDEPSFTLKTSGGGRVRRVYEYGRVVSLTDRCLARLQSFPDSYRLPAKKTLSSTGIGNSVPPLLMQRVIESF